MKKNVMMRLASFLLVAVLISTSAISGTYAKYVTEGTSSDNARVAKWGVEINDTADMFATSYASDQNIISLTKHSVISTEKVVAPGTSGVLTAVTVRGIPEVAAYIEHKVSSIKLENWEITVDGVQTFYCPLEFTIGSEVVKGVDYVGNKAGLINAIVGKVAATHVAEAGTDLNVAKVGDLNVSWNWVYVVSDLYNKYDTLLGDQAAKGTAATVELFVTTTVSQID